MNYDQFSYLTPPRAEAKIPSALLGLYERRGWVAQFKKNGTNSVIFVPPDRKPFAYNRHGEPHKQWAFNQSSARFFSGLPGFGWYVFNAELLHSKVSGGPRNTNYLHDVLVFNGTYLVGETYAFRYDQLYRLAERHFQADKATLSHFVLDSQTWLARSIPSGFKRLYAGLEEPEDEGIVVKDPQGKLSTVDGRGAPWMAKCRKAQKNYGF